MGNADSRVRIAALDGSSVVVATMQRRNMQRPSSIDGTTTANQTALRWLLKRRFKVRDGAGYCRADPAVCSAWREPKNYADVRALQVGHNGETLSLLHGSGVLDAWNLTTGTLLGRWPLGTGYTAMCHNGSELRLARRDERGPVLEVAPLPQNGFEPVVDV